MSPFFYSYLITDPIEYGLELHQFEKKLSLVLENKNVDMLCFRDKIAQNNQPFAKICLEAAKKYNIPKILTNGNIEQALELGFNGVHLTSTQFDLIKKAKSKGLFTIISCHTQEEIALAKKDKADAVTYSPIFYKENKGEPKGFEILREMVEKYQEENFSIIALGGITDDTKIQQVKDTHCRGFASITYFTNNL